MSKLLVVDDEERIRSMIRKYGEFEGHEIEEAVDGMDAIEKCKQAEYDLIIMDIMMPNLDGFSAVKEIRKDVQTPVIMLSARGEEYDRIHGFEIGVDDYVVKPFELEVLYSRILALLRRTHYAAEPYLSCDGILIDQNRRAVSCQLEEICLSAAEYQLLLYLMQNKGRTVTREKILEQVWDVNGNYVNNNTLTVTMKRLRDKLHQPSCLKTVRSVGYSMEDTI